MRIAVASNLPVLNAPVGRRLTRSKYLLIIDINTMKSEAIANPFILIKGPAAWKLFAHELLQEKVSKIIAANCSSKISKSLGSVGIQVISGLSGTVLSVVKQFKEMCMADTIIFPDESTKD